MQTAIITFVCGFMLCAVNGGFLVWALMRRVRELEKFVLIKDDPHAYVMATNEPIVNEVDEETQMEREFLRAVMSETVTDDDIEKFGMKEPIA